MNFPRAKSQHLNEVLPDDLIREVLSFLTVKSLTQFKCVCKSWKTLICDPTFIKLHLKKSERKRHITLIYDLVNIVCFPLCRLIQNNPITFAANPYFNEPCFQDPYFHDSRSYSPQHRDLQIVGSCNGLLCLNFYVSTADYEEIFLYLWNPATKTLSNKIVFLHDEFHLRKRGPDQILLELSLHGYWNFWFGYHNSTDNYKIVAFCRSTNEVRVFNLGDNVWRNIQCFPVVPCINISTAIYNHLGINDGVYVSGAINWLAIRNENPFTFKLESMTIDQFVIISLDLSTETYNQFSLPYGFDTVPLIEPTLTMLMDSLCFSHDFHKTYFIIWQMKEFGVEESWTQFLKISYHQNLPIIYNENLFIYPLSLFPLCLSENDDSLIFAWDENNLGFIHNLRDNRGENTRIGTLMQWFGAKIYVESLVSTSWE